MFDFRPKGGAKMPIKILKLLAAPLSTTRRRRRQMKEKFSFVVLFAAFFVFQKIKKNQQQLNFRWREIARWREKKVKEKVAIFGVKLFFENSLWVFFNLELKWNWTVSRNWNEFRFLTKDFFSLAILTN